MGFGCPTELEQLYPPVSDRAAWGRRVHLDAPGFGRGASRCTLLGGCGSGSRLSPGGAGQAMCTCGWGHWVPAFAGMTVEGVVLGASCIFDAPYGSARGANKNGGVWGAAVSCQCFRTSVLVLDVLFFRHFTVFRIEDDGCGAGGRCGVGAGLLGEAGHRLAHRAS